MFWTRLHNGKLWFFLNCRGVYEKVRKLRENWKEEKSGISIFTDKGYQKTGINFLMRTKFSRWNFEKRLLYSSSEKVTVRKYSSKQRLNKSNCKKNDRSSKKLRTKIEIILMTKDSDHFLHPAGYNVGKSFDLKKKLISIRKINFVPKFRNICCPHFLRICYF